MLGKLMISSFQIYNFYKCSKFFSYVFLQFSEIDAILDKFSGKQQNFFILNDTGGRVVFRRFGRKYPRSDLKYHEVPKGPSDISNLTEDVFDQ